MKKPIIFSLFIFLCVACHAQKNLLKVDTFSFSNYYGSFYLLINSDSSFFWANQGHTDVGISKGDWKIKNGKLFLLSDKPSKVSIKPDIDNMFFEKDTILTLKVLDYFKNPLPQYGLTFFNNDLKEFLYVTNDSGIVRVPKGVYVGYLTIDELDNSVGYALPNLIHFLWNGVSYIKLTLNYPKKILYQGINVHPIDYKGDIFIKTKTGLKSIQSHLLLEKL